MTSEKKPIKFKNLEISLSRRSTRSNAYSHQELFYQVAGLKPNEVFAALGGHAKGLLSSQVEELQEQFGLNEVVQDKTRWQSQLFRAMVNPFIILLLILAIVSYSTDDSQGALVMTVMVGISVALTFFQEFRSSRAAEKLKNMVRTTATVIRRMQAEPEEEWISQKIDIPISELVRGDLITLSACDMIPADVRLTTPKDF